MPKYDPTDPAIAAALTRAGVGAVYHHRNLADFGPEAKGIIEFLKQNHDAIFTGTQTGVFVGEHLGGLLTMLTRAMLLNGVSARKVSLREFWRAKKRNDEDWDDLKDRAILIVEAQTNQPLPFSYADMRDLEDWFHDRITNARGTLLHWGIDTFPGSDIWWSSAFVAEVRSLAPVLTAHDLRSWGGR